jgi:hypothetical protein
VDVKGSVLQSLPKFIQTKFGNAALATWLERLSPEAREIYSSPILASVWHPIIPFLAEPTVAICDLFYSGDLRGAWDSGRYSAKMALSGIYRIFAVAAPAPTVLKKGSTAMGMLYNPCEVVFVPGEGKKGVLRITKFPDPHPALDARLGGFVEESLVICGCKHPVVTLGSMISKGHRCSEYHISWD